MRSVTSPLKKAAGIACPTALLFRVHHTLLGLVSDSVSGTVVTHFPATPGLR